MTKSFCELLVESFESRPDLVAMRVVGRDDNVYTFAEMLHAIRTVAYRLGQEGVGFGDRVALIGENHPSWAIAYLGTLYHGSVCVPLDPHGEIETITNFLENSEAKVAFLSPDQIDRFEQIQTKLGRKIPAVVWDLENANGEFQKLEDWLTTEFPAELVTEAPPAKGDDIALLMYTSGTTGTPKGVPLTHGNIIGELSGVNDVLKLTEKERILSLLPLFHAYLQIVNLWVATTFGPQVGYLKELTPAELSESMKLFKPTILTTVPRLWYLFHKKIFDAVDAKPKMVQRLFRTMLKLNGFSRDRLGVNLGRKLFGEVHASFGGELRIAISAGSRFDDAVAEDFHRLGFTIIQGYGLTETSGAATATHEDDNRVGSVGKPMKGAEIKIMDPDKDGVGEVLIRGTMVFNGYYQNPDATKDAFTEDGWFRSGDLGRIDSDGFLYIVGRGKDVIVLPSGKNVHPEDIEVHYLKCPLVAELAIIGVEDESEARAGAEKLAAVVVPDFDYLKREKIANSKEAIRHALDNLGRELPEYQRVRDYMIRAEPLPRTATNKIKRFQLKKEVESGEIEADANVAKTWETSADEAALLETSTAKTVVAAIRQNSKDIETVHPSMNLEIDLGLDSLARAETFAALEQAFSTEFDGEEAATALTVANVIDLVNKHGGEDVENASIELNWGNIVREADDDFPEVRGILRDRPFFAAFAWTVYKIFRFFFALFTRLEVDGLENLHALVDADPQAEDKSLRPFIICPNHQSFLDPFVLCSTYPYRLFRNVFHVGASEFFEGRLMQTISKMLNVVPVNPDTELMKAMKAGAIGLKHGKILNIYPEGERAFDGELHAFKKGAAILATELDLPILPVALDGLYKVWPRHSMRIRPAKVKIRIGKPIYAQQVIQEAALKQLPAEALAAAAAGGPLVVSPRQIMSADESYALVTKTVKETIESMINDLRSE
ncbi:MAG TPA: AMP-binding protein [Pyrinomonadaceae bacterium]|jgi:long-chain acyl-CoA synthetase|nr:AMP-binding protein [Pyrinomonadaceae bacterium]